MNYDEYYEARESVVSILKEDLLGPGSKDEQIDDPPVGYYLLGKLYPQNMDGNNQTEKFEMDCEDDVLEDDNSLISSTKFFQSAMGITFSLEASTQLFEIVAEAAIYEEVLINQEKSKKQIKNWKRKEIKEVESIQVNDLKKIKKLVFVLTEGMELQVKLHKISMQDALKITCSLVNTNVAKSSKFEEISTITFFQPQIKIMNLHGGDFIVMNTKNRVIVDEETKNLELLYHESKNFASAHGCAVEWKCDENGKVKEVFSSHFPEYELLQMKAAGQSGDLFSMKYLSTASYEQIQRAFEEFINGYQNWIANQKLQIKTLDQSLVTIANKNIEYCKTTMKRLRENCKYLENPDILRAFHYANETMRQQRFGMNMQEADDISWYPFQLMFILQEIKSIVEPESEERELVDLLWFPTGGGKTEAYLGVSAFALFSRRINALNNGKRDDGVAVIMRYTLRLLSLQQLERASNMICTAEFIRRREKLGDTPFDIGLWAGSSLTPNTLEDAEEFLNKGRNACNSSPVQIKKCPWCGAKLDEYNYHVDKETNRMKICCSNKKCDYADGLPIMLIDEEIYENRPSFLIGTVDKFAQLSFKEKAGELFHKDEVNPPELIIQDELHLISGPLGTISGIYECAIEKICENNGIKPKIIAATATIRNADSQIMQLYGKEKRLFPPQGITINDSYFAVLSSRDERPARKYVGIMPNGASKTTAFTRIMASLLYATRYLVDLGYSDEIVDSFWTETGYFNTLKELGSALTRVTDSVQDRFKYLKQSKFKNKYPIKNEKMRYERYFELTSRNTGVDLSTALQENLQVSFSRTKKTEPVDVLLASNMISVGVDVSRLGAMLMIGQPLKNAEYIQATSRVGRATPGLVLTLYQPSNSRDRSHYEQFNQYHSTLYKFVEATSLTPFADRARDRALQSLYLILVRNFIYELKDNKKAKRFNRDIKGLEEIREYIFSYVALVDPNELENVKREIGDIEQEWEEQASHHGDDSEFVYWDYSDKMNCLYEDDIAEGKRFRMMNSMRDVEPSVDVYVEE